MPEGLNWDQIQGNITPGFRSSRQLMLFLRFPEDLDRARSWLEELRHVVAFSREVHAYNHVYRTMKHRDAEVAGEDVLQEDRREARLYRFIRTTWVNVAISYEGFRALDARWHESFHPAFRHGLYRADGPVTADISEAGGAAQAHVMLTLAADRMRDLDAEFMKQRRLADRWGLTRLTHYVGTRLPGKREHFGFRDGISQPRLAGPLDSFGKPVETTAPGEFILGYRGDDQVIGGFMRPLEAPFWSNDGSYLAFLRLRQDVKAFEQELVDRASASGNARDRCAAELMGRWRSGAKIGKPPEPNDPGWSGSSSAQISLSDFANDPAGARFPRHSHVRKAFPRDLVHGSPDRLWSAPAGLADARQHRMLRRGIPYGRARDDDRGLLFVSYQASLADQFEFVARRWIAATDFPMAESGPDPLLRGLFRPPGAPAGGATPASDHRKFVTLTDGGYFFAPSRRALAFLADPDRELSV